MKTTKLTTLLVSNFSAAYLDILDILKQSRSSMTVQKARLIKQTTYIGFAQFILIL
jgi:hypothetical protein